MIYRKLDADGDMTFGGGQNDFHRNVPDGVAQAVMTRLRLWRGEWFADNTAGTPWLTHVLGERTSEIRDAVIRSRIIDTPGVNRLVDYTSAVDVDTRHMTVNAEIDTIYGQTRFAQELKA